MNARIRVKNTSLIQIVLSALALTVLYPHPAVPLEWVSWTNHPRIALTFDDGPHPEPTLLLCDVLERYHVPATFFIVGRVAVQYPTLLHKIVHDGHELASHTWTHANIRNQSTEKLREELDRTRELICTVTGQQTFLFRTPGATESYLRHMFRVPVGYQLVLWDVHSLDQEGISPEQIAERVLSQVKSGDVVLMHNGIENTRDALGIIIPTLKNRGYEFVTVSELLKHRPSSEAHVARPTFVQG